MAMRASIFTVALLASPASAAFDPTDPKPDLVQLQAIIDEGRPGDAVTPLYDWLIKEPKDADVLNLLGYAYRKLQRYEKARTYYAQALAVEPAHLGALEYMGELELEAGNPAAAKTLLARLRTACPGGCKELEDLLQAFDAHDIPAAQ